MQVTKNLEKLEKSRVKLSVTVPANTALDIYSSTLDNYAKNARINGFRKGKVPKSVLEQKYGEAIRIDTASTLMQEAFTAAMKDDAPQPLSYADPELDEVPVFEPNKDFSFSMSYDVFPDVPLSDISGIELDVAEIVIGKKDEERELKDIQERNAIVMDKADGLPSANGDVVTVNFSELEDDLSPTKGTERQDFVFELGTEYNIYKFDADVVGMKKNEEKVISKSFPEDFEYSELAGKTKKIKITLTHIKEKKLPDLDDDFAQDVSEKFNTLADLKKDIRLKLEKQAEQGQKSLTEKAIIEELLSKTTIELPESMIMAEISARFDHQLQQSGLNPSDFKKNMPEEYFEKLFTDLRPSSEKSLKTRLILDKLVKNGKYEASDSDIDAEFEKMAEGSAMSATELKAKYAESNLLEYIKNRIKEDKLLSDLEKTVKIKKAKKINLLDLNKEIS